MKRLLTIFRGSLHTIVYALVLLFVVLYLSIHFNLAGLVVEHSLTTQLAKQLNTRVTVEGDIEVDWLNQVVLNQLTIYDQQDDTLLYARRVLVAYDVLPLLSHHLVLNTCQLIDFDIRASRASSDSIANYQFLIDALREKNDPDSQPFIQRLDLNAILLRQGYLSYDVLDKPQMLDSPIDPYHISISKLSANVHVHDTLLTIKKFHCDEHNTAFKADQFCMALNIMQLLKSPEGENHFLMSLKGFDMESPQINCRTDIEGTSDDIRINLKNLSLPTGHPRLPQIHLLQTSAQININELRKPLDSLYINADINHFEVSADTIGRISANGHIEGRICHSMLNLSMISAIGNAELATELQFLAPQEQPTSITSPAKSVDLAQRKLIIQGNCKAKEVELSKIVPKQWQLGQTSVNAAFKAEYQQQHPLEISANGSLETVNWKNHTYNDIRFDGKSKGQNLSGNIALTDTLGDVKANFALDLSPKQRHYKLDGSITRFNPNGLNITDISNFDSISISSNIHADLLASSWRDLEGEVYLTDLCLEKGNQRIELEPVTYEGTALRGNLSSPVVHLQYVREKKNSGYQVSGYVPANHTIFEMFQLPFATNRISHFDIHVDSLQLIDQAHLDIPSLDLLQGRSLALALDMESDEEGILCPELDFEILTSDHTLSGTLQGRVCLDPLDVDIAPATFSFDRGEVRLTGAHLQRTDEGEMRIDNLQLTGNAQSLAVSGSMSKAGEKDFTVSLRNFELDQIFSSLDKGYLNFGGRATGNILVKNSPDLHLSSDDLTIEHFSYIDTLLGDARFLLDYAIDKKHMEVACDIETTPIHQTHIDCEIKMGKCDSLDLRVNPDHLPLGFINYWTGGILQNLSGTVTGPVRLYGDVSQMQLAGDPMVDVRFTHQIVGAHFHLRDKVHLEDNLLSLEHAWVDDCHGHPLTLDAQVTHDHLHNWGYDVNLEMPDANQGFLALDRQQAPGRIYWGQLYAKGQAHLRGGNGKHRFNINVGTTDKSWFYLSPREQDLSPEQEAYAFLTFRDKKQLELQAAEEAEQAQIERTQTIHIPISDEDDSPTDLQVDLQVNVSDQCEVTVQMDPLSEDLLKGRGTGNLSVRYDPRRDITLAGTYNINHGTYTMNVKGDLVSKVFQLQNSSFCKFNGVPSEAELQLDCRYNIPSVNLTDLDESITTLSSLSRSSVPVDCNLCISGPISQPLIRFDLEVKNVSDEIQAYVHNIIGTQEMLNQEVLYLLIFSKFYTPQYAQSQSRTGSELTSFASASITSQLNQLLGHLSNNFTMGTNFRSDKGDFSDMEMDVSLSTRLLGDRLLLNGNVGYRDPANRIGTASNATSFIGDFDLEFLMNSRGTFRAKAYSHYNERDYSINNALTTQGVGLILRKDFRYFHELWPLRLWYNNPTKRDSIQVKTASQNDDEKSQESVKEK